MRQKTNSLLWTSGIILSLFSIITACSVTDNGKDDTPDEPEIIEAVFKENFLGTYTSSTTVKVSQEGLGMDFSASTVRVSTMVDTAQPFYFTMYINGSPGASTLHGITFLDGDPNNGFTQELEVHSPTNATLKNIMLTPTTGNGDRIYNAIGSLMINLDTKQVIYNGTIVATKN